MINDNVDFVGIGAMKAGTTWIAQCLKEHPEICLSEPKEVRFFNKVYEFCKPKEWNYPKGIKWYLDHFKHCEENQKKGEFSIDYIFDPSSAKLIKNNFPNIKIIACLRNPIFRAFSQYHHTLKKFPEIKNELNNFEDAIKKEGEFIERGLYYKQLKRYYDLFPSQNILVLIYEDIQKNPELFIKKIYNFLEIDDNFVPPSLCKRINKRQEFFIKSINTYLNKSYNAISAYPRILNLLKKSNVKKIIKIINKKSDIQTPKIKKDVVVYIREAIKADCQKLETLINRRLDLWLKN